MFDGVPSGLSTTQTCSCSTSRRDVLERLRRRVLVVEVVPLDRAGLAVGRRDAALRVVEVLEPGVDALRHRRVGGDRTRQRVRAAERASSRRSGPARSSGHSTAAAASFGSTAAAGRPSAVVPAVEPAVVPAVVPSPSARRRRLGGRRRLGRRRPSSPRWRPSRTRHRRRRCRDRRRGRGRARARRSSRASARFLSWMFPLLVVAGVLVGRMGVTVRDRWPSGRARRPRSGTTPGTSARPRRRSPDAPRACAASHAPKPPRAGPITPPGARIMTRMMITP